MRTNVPPGGKNAVTWGVFPGREIAQSTIIEKDSFFSWKVNDSRNSSFLSFFLIARFVGGGVLNLAAVGPVLSAGLRRAKVLGVGPQQSVAGKYRAS